MLASAPPPGVLDEVSPDASPRTGCSSPTGRADPIRYPSHGSGTRSLDPNKFQSNSSEGHHSNAGSESNVSKPSGENATTSQSCTRPSGNTSTSEAGARSPRQTTAFEDMLEKRLIGIQETLDHRLSAIQGQIFAMGQMPTQLGSALEILTYVQHAVAGMTEHDGITTPPTRYVDTTSSSKNTSSVLFMAAERMAQRIEQRSTGRPLIGQPRGGNGSRGASRRNSTAGFSTAGARFFNGPGPQLHSALRSGSVTSLLSTPSSICYPAGSRRVSKGDIRNPGGAAADCGALEYDRRDSTVSGAYSETSLATDLSRSASMVSAGSSHYSCDNRLLRKHVPERAHLRVPSVIHSEGLQSYSNSPATSHANSRVPSPGGQRDCSPSRGTGSKEPPISQHSSFVSQGQLKPGNWVLAQSPHKGRDMDTAVLVRPMAIPEHEMGDARKKRRKLPSYFHDLITNLVGRTTTGRKPLPESEDLPVNKEEFDVTLSNGSQSSQDSRPARLDSMISYSAMSSRRSRDSDGSYRPPAQFPSLNVFAMNSDSPSPEGSPGASPSPSYVPGGSTSFILPVASAARDSAGKADHLARSSKISYMMRSLISPVHELEEDSFNVIIFPYSTFSIAWDTVLILITFMAAILIPLGFQYWSTGDLIRGTSGVFVNIADALFILDIPITFRTALVDGAHPIMDGKTIAKRYMRGWLTVDLVAAWPIVTVPPGTMLYTALCILKQLRLFRLPRLFSRFRKIYSPIKMRLAEVALLVLTISHILACLWRNVQMAEEELALMQNPDAEWWDFYVEDVYWVMMTMTTVGYGDIHPVGTTSRVYCIFAMAVASILFGGAISFLTNASKSLFHDEVERRVSDARKFMRGRHIPEALQRRVQHNLRYRLQQDQQENQRDLLKLLSPALQRDLSLALLKDTVLHFPLLKDAQHSFVAELAQAHNWVQCLPGDCVAERGQAVQELVFLTRGQLLACFDRGHSGVYFDDPAAPSRPSTLAASQVPSQVPSQAPSRAGQSPLAERVERRKEGSLTSSGVSLPSASSGSTEQFDEQEDFTRSRDVLHDPARRSCMAVAAHTQVTIASGAWFGESCLFNLHHVRAATMTAMSESELAVLTAVSYVEVIHKYPKLLERHMDIEARLHDGTLDIRKLAYTPIEEDGDEFDKNMSGRAMKMLKKTFGTTVSGGSMASARS